LAKPLIRKGIARVHREWARACRFLPTARFRRTVMQPRARLTDPAQTLPHSDSNAIAAT